MKAGYYKMEVGHHNDFYIFKCLGDLLEGSAEFPEPPEASMVVGKFKPSFYPQQRFNSEDCTAVFPTPFERPETELLSMECHYAPV